MPQVGDIVKVLDTNEKKIIVDSRTEIVPLTGDWSNTDELRARTRQPAAGLSGRPRTVL